MWKATDEELRDVVAEALTRSVLPEVQPKDVRTERISHAYPIYDRDYETHFNILDEWADRQPRLVTFGRQGLFAHDNLHHALAAADSLNDNGSWNNERWGAARRRFESHVVED